MKIRTRVHKIGITGSARAGKTVFLLSLINQLEYGGLNLGDDKTRLYRRLPPHDKRDEFDYDLLRKHLAVNEEWPAKTKDSSFWRCSFECSSAIVNKDEIEFFDFPGERVADVTMVNQSFGEWSDMMIRSLTNDPGKAVASASFIRAIEQDDPQQEDIVAAWKLALGHLILDCHALITPSTFLIDSDGKEVRERVRKKRRAEGAVDLYAADSADELAAVGCAGCLGREFAPLPANVRENAPELARCFAQHYEHYQQAVVRPFAAHLLSCDALIYLVDVTDVLGSGMQKFNDTQDIIEKLLDCIQRRREFTKWMARGALNLVLWLKMVGRRIKLRSVSRVAFVASKADKVHEEDHDNLEKLIKGLAGNLAERCGLSDVEYFICKAVNSTTSRHRDEKKVLEGRPLWEQKVVPLKRRPPTDKEIEVPVPDLPGDWSNNWLAGDFRFTDFHPKIPANHREPPQHAKINEVLKFVLYGK